MSEPENKPERETEPVAGPEPGRAAVFDRRFAALARLGVGVDVIATWDRTLSRRTRILVPADVQAFVVPPSGAEPTVALTGDTRDPKPFAPGSKRPEGVHLHWAMPDALLAAEGAEGDETLPMPLLPDRWVVVRTVQPDGARQVGLAGWVLDARTGSTTPLAEFTGTPADPPPNTPVIEPLDGATGGSLLWTASYTASAGRFAFHDPLKDLGDKPLDGNQAAYTVAGWWSDLAHDPLAQAAGPQGLDARVAELGWWVVHDDDDYALVEEDPRLVRQRADMGLDSPVETARAKVTGADGRVVSGALDAITFDQAMPVTAAEQVILMPALPRYATLVHGSVLGVPIDGTLPADDRPSGSELGLSLGQDTDDVVAAFGAAVLGLAAEHRSSAETLVAAFTSGVIEQLGSVDGLEDLAEREHGDGFWPLPGTPLPASRPDRLRAEDSAAMGPMTVGRKGRAAQSPARLKTTISWADKALDLKTTTTAKGTAGKRTVETPLAPTGKDKAQAREVVRPAPRYFAPQAPMVALRGVRPSHRHHGDGLFDETGRLRCRYPRECVPEIQGVVTGAAVVPSLGSGAVPAEVLTVVREAVLLNPYGYAWLAAAGAPSGPAEDVFRNRIAAEMVRLFGTEGRYDGTSHVIAVGPDLPSPSGERRAAADRWAGVTAGGSMVDLQVSAVLAEHSLVRGTPPSPVAITTWRQPWVPLWLEWQVTLDGTDAVADWRLDGLDLEPPPDRDGPSTHVGKPVTVTLVGRSPIGQGVSTALHEGITRWLETERSRDATGDSTLPDADRDTLARLGDLLVPLDLVSASLDGIREQLLGIAYVGVLDRGETDDPPAATGAPVPLFGGRLRVDRLRLVDAFGRLLDVPSTVIEAATTATHLEVDGFRGGMRLRPRIQHKARWLFRLVDPEQPAGTEFPALREAYVDQVEPAGGVNPVAGFLLPDHIDESLEAFTVAGGPLGEIGHDAVTGAVRWEPAPGRPLPPDAGPLSELDGQSRIVGEIAAGLVLADAAARNAGSPPSSALTALLRAVDTTLWTVDTFAAVGSSTIAGLVGRPVAVVRAALTLDAPDDLDEVQAVASGDPDARAAAFAAMRELRFPVRLGALTRSDDALLGFYVDDDYAHLHLVDRVVAAHAIDSGRLRGHLGLLGAATTPGFDPLAHPYLVSDGTLLLRAGQTVRLTLLMLPIGRVHLTSGVLPRKQLALADDWVTPGLRKLVPSVRVGPVLVDPAEIRLPLVNLLGDQQTFTRRTGPLTWRDDPIVAATQTAYLPRLPHEAQEGWVRVTPDDADTTEAAP